MRLALREKQLREQAYARLNGIKIHNQWRKIMRMAKVRTEGGGSAQAPRGGQTWGPATHLA